MIALALCGAGSAGIAADISAPTDSTVILDTLYHVDIDSLLLCGQGVLLAFEDTIPFRDGSIDTVLVSAPRIKVSEVVRRVGERMEADWARMKEHAFTSVTKLVARREAREGKPRRWTTFEIAERIRKGPDGGYQRARIWQRERDFVDDELIEEKIDDEVDVGWEELGGAVIGAIPFSLDSGDRYNYEILDRQLVGMNVVYKLRYWPKSRFEALPAGTVWVDFADFVIRRVEAAMTEAVPLPLFIESIPVYRMRRVQKGDFWVLDDLYARIELRALPLVKIPAEVEFYHRSTRHVINGVAYPDEIAQRVEPDEIDMLETGEEP